jgi:hypothetical protein
MTDILDLILSTPRLEKGLSEELNLPLYNYVKPGFDGVKCRRSQEQIPIMPADAGSPSDLPGRRTKRAGGESTRTYLTVS